MSSGALKLDPALLDGTPDRVFFNGDGLVKLLFRTEKLTFAQFEILPGGRLNVDVHPEGDEAYYVAEGTCTVRLPETGEIYEVHRGEAFLIPHNVQHEAINLGGNKLLVIAAIGPRP